MSEYESEAGPTKGIAELIADKENMYQRIKQLQQQLSAAEAAIDLDIDVINRRVNILRELLAERIAWRLTAALSKSRAKLAEAEALLETACDAWECGRSTTEAGVGYRAAFLNVDWYERAKEACDGK